MQIRKTSRKNPKAENPQQQPVLPRKRLPVLRLRRSHNKVRISKVATMRPMCPMCTLTCRYTFRQTLHQTRLTRFLKVWRNTYIEKVDIGVYTDGANCPTSRETSTGPKHLLVTYRLLRGRAPVPSRYSHMPWCRAHAGISRKSYFRLMGVTKQVGLMDAR